MKNYMLKLFIFTLLFGLVVSASEGDEMDESTPSDSPQISSEVAGQPNFLASTETEASFGADFHDDSFEDPLAPLMNNSEAVQAGQSANSPANLMDSSGSDGIFPLDFAAADFKQEAGYTAPGMDPLLAGSLVANTNVDLLFKKYASLRSQSGITLPEEFRDLVGYVMGYIQANSKQGADTANGLTHWALAVQIVKASFCYGNDPFMLTAKIRRETSFNRTGVSSGSAVGFSQMTGAGIKEVQDQMSGNSRISMPNALRSFQVGARCYAGIPNFRLPVLNNVEMKKELRSRYRLDLTFGQIMAKAYVSYAKATERLSSSAEDIAKAYGLAFVMYNGDSAPTAGTCMGLKSVAMKFEYSCNITQYFKNLSTNWDRLLAQKRRRARLNQTY